MSQISRTGVSLEEDLLKEFDQLIAKRGYKNRSEALRDLIREALVAEAVDLNKPVVGTLTLIYDHHLPNLTQKLTEAQHHAHGMVLANTHVHLDHVYCLEVILMQGPSKDIKEMSDKMLSLRGVKHGKLVLTSPGEDVKKQAHTHSHPHKH
jgi:CopG family transcriptional regulator, nickel-responsive regulator